MICAVELGIWAVTGICLYTALLWYNHRANQRYNPREVELRYKSETKRGAAMVAMPVAWLTGGLALAGLPIAWVLGGGGVVIAAIVILAAIGIKSGPE